MVVQVGVQRIEFRRRLRVQLAVLNRVDDLPHRNTTRRISTSSLRSRKVLRCNLPRGLLFSNRSSSMASIPSSSACTASKWPSTITSSRPCTKDPTPYSCPPSSSKRCETVSMSYHGDNRTVMSPRGSTNPEMRSGAFVRARPRRVTVKKVCRRRCARPRRRRPRPRNCSAPAPVPGRPGSHDPDRRCRTTPGRRPRRDSPRSRRIRNPLAACRRATPGLGLRSPIHHVRGRM